ncbi:hypothetical protein LK09_17070 [Microbacterium mangrovi]|uniref:KAP NTPase domain-containing protein n=1 Tax=Microbacterium mangrovi TaxID=1348253 RepID=A0A0B1ZZ88_9MICO|nr:hypothetical protein [Microbacterium mangrovi]KHK96056.1 hypothetical protein LK09_17070 [Microbacterium mangrovi]
MTISALSGEQLAGLDFGWLPEPYEEPWQSFESPAQTLEALVDAEMRGSDLGGTAGGVRAAVLRDANALLEGAFEQQQRFLRRLERLNQQNERVGRHPGLRWVGLGMLLFGILGGLIGLLLAPYLLARSLNLATVWVIVIPIALLVTLGALVLVVYGSAPLWVSIRIVVGVAEVVATVGFVWAAIQLTPGTVLGVVLGLAVSAVFFAVGMVGNTLWTRYGVDHGYELQTFYDQWRATLLKVSVVPALNAAMNAATVTNYSLKLHLSGPISPAGSPAVIDTSAANDLREAMAWRTSGSFALAGPRGSGKTTLLHRWASGAYAGGDSSTRAVRRDLIVEVSAPVGYDQKEFLVYLFGRLCEAVEGYARRYATAAMVDASGRVVPARPSLPGIRDAHPQARADVDGLPSLVRLAQHERDTIRYIQRTTSSRELSAGVGYSGLSLGGKAGESIERSKVPLNYPELVDEFRWFLEQAAKVVTTEPADRQPSRLLGPYAIGPYTPPRPPEPSAPRGSVLIAIDELDRISDGELAQKFINELKAVFGVPNCYVLVSVSEDALAEFELAAMGLRTVFDSAFDEIIRVDYLGLSEAEELLDRLVVGLPRPFVALAYVMSGGLARQLVRIAYQIAEMGRADTGATLDETSARLVQRQLHRTVRAASDRLFGSVESRLGADLFRQLDELSPKDAVSSSDLRIAEGTLRTLATTPDDPAFISGLRDELAAMCNYLATVLEIFDSTLGERRFERRLGSGPGSYDTLARARRYLGANPHAADELLATFRQVH